MKNKFLNRVLAVMVSLAIFNISGSLKPLAAQENPPATTETMLALKVSQQRWIEVNLSTQSLIAWEGDRQIYTSIVSTGKEETPTLPGVFAIQSKHPVARMQGADYDIPDVPYTLYYYQSYALHGAYWHNNFGTPVSHGCINLPVANAEWLFEWVKVGTPVIIHY